MLTSRRTDLVLVFVAAVWGSSYLAAKVAASAAPVVIVLFLRYALSVVACTALVLSRRRAGVLTRDERLAGVLLGLTQAAVLALETYGVAHTSAANAGLIISLTIVLTPLVDSAAHGTRLPSRFFAAAVVCLLGVALLVSSTGLRAPGGGDLLMLAAAVVRAVHVSLLGRLTIGRSVRPVQLTMIQAGVGTLVLGAAGARQMPAITHLSASTWAVVGYLALACSVFAFLAQTWAVQRTSASRASLLLGTEPVWAVTVGIVLGGEHLTLFASFGAALVVAGAYIGQRIERSHRVDRQAVAVVIAPAA